MAELPTPPTRRGAALRWTLPTCVLAWLVPGCGHLLVGRWARALVFGILIAALFFGGLALDGKVYRPVAGDPLSYLAALGASGVGSLYMAAHAFELGDGDVAAPYHEYGNTFTPRGRFAEPARDTGRVRFRATARPRITVQARRSRERGMIHFAFLCVFAAAVGDEAR